LFAIDFHFGVSVFSITPTLCESQFSSVNPVCQNLGSADMQIIAIGFVLHRLYHTPFV
jgi:hypothetical protein